MNQADLTERIKNNDTAVFPGIVKEFQAMVYNTALSMLQNETDAEDITQEVFIDVYEKLQSFREESKLSTWIYRITINKVLDFEKKKRRHKHGGLLKRIFSVSQEEEPVSFFHPGVALDNKENAAVLLKALKKLPEKQQVAFTLHKIEGLSYQEVSDVMETTLYAVESLIARAKTGLKKILENYYQSSQ